MEANKTLLLFYIFLDYSLFTKMKKSRVDDNTSKINDKTSRRRINRGRESASTPHKGKSKTTTT